jgi:hypothetical protein
MLPFYGQIQANNFQLLFKEARSASLIEKMGKSDSVTLLLG